MTYLELYADMIRNGDVIVGAWIKKEVRRLIADLSDDRYIYDTAEAQKRIKFMESCCLQSKAPYYMQPLELMPWQKAFFEALYSFRNKSTGKRRFVEALLEIARKNGKTSMCAGDGTFDLFVGQGGQDICCASNDDRQAKLIWSEMAGMRQRLDPKNAVTKKNLTELYNKLKNITCYRLSSKTQNKDGFNISKLYLDESHDIAEENGQSEVAEAGWRSMSTKEEPLFINCTTQGFNRDCYLDHRISYCKKVIDGEIDDDGILPFLYEQDSEQEVWQDPESWEKSNPSLRYGIKKIDKLKRDVETAKHDSATRIHLLTKDFNIPQNTAQAWLMLEDFDYTMPEINLEQFRDTLILGAVDLSATTDLSAANILMMKPDDHTKYVLSHYWIPETKLQDSDDREAGARYMEWAKAGLLTICEGTEVDISDVAMWYFRMYKEYGFRPLMIGYDQRFSKPFLDTCEQLGFEKEMLAQGRNLCNAMRLTEADLKARRLNYFNNPIDKWCLANTSAKVDGYGNIQPIKIQAPKRIDGAVTLIMLEEVFRRHRAEFLNQYIKGLRHGTD